MEHVSLHETMHWLENNKGSVKLLKSFFEDRINLEETVEALWRVFACKWQKILKNLKKDPLFGAQNGSKSLADILRQLAKEPEKNNKVCCSVKSLLQRKQNSPTALLQKWLSSCAANEKEYKITYQSVVNAMNESEKNVTMAQRIPNEKENVELAKSYEKTLNKYTEENASFCEKMKELQNYLQENEKSRLDVVKESLQKYTAVIGEYDQQRMSRKQRMLVAREELSQFSGGKSVEQWLQDLQEPSVMFQDFEAPVEKFQVVKDSEEDSPVKKKETSVEVEKVPSEKVVHVVSAEEVDAAVDEIVSVQEETSSQNSTRDYSYHSCQSNVDDDIIPASSDTDNASSVYAVQSFHSPMPEHLSFSFGQKIKQVSPADSLGWAYGFTTSRKWLWSKKDRKYGVFPVQLVATKRPKLYLTCQCIC